MTTREISMNPILEAMMYDPENLQRLHGVVVMILVFGLVCIAEMCFFDDNNGDE